MITDGTLHAFVPVAGPVDGLVERFSADPRGWLPERWRGGWVTLSAGPRTVPARCSLGPPSVARTATSRTVLLEPHGGRAAAPGLVGTVELRTDGTGATLLLRARYRYAHPHARAEDGHRLAHEAAVGWLTRLAGALERAADLQEHARAVHPAGGRRRFGRLRLVPG